MLPFTHEQFVDVFVRYNEAIGPTPVIAYALGGVVLVAALRGAGRLASAGLAAMWLWTGVVYHGLFFATINPVARAFGLLFVVQGLLLLRHGVQTGRLRFTAAARGSGASPVIAGLAWFFVLYATVLYPVLGLLTGHAYPRMPMFGVTPCPVTLFTFGVLLLAAAPLPKSLLVVPVAWSFIGGSAAFLLRVPQDWVLLAAGLAVVPVLWRDALGHRLRA